MSEMDPPRPWTGELTSAALERLGATPLRRVDPAAIGPYRVLARLGGGGMGRQYLGREAALDGSGAYGADSLVAVKVIRSEYAEDERFRRRFEREIDAVRRVHGRYTAELLGSGFDEQEERLWMATSYVPGLSLSAAVEKFGPMPAPMVWRLAHEIGQALGSLAAAGIVHRDLKPANVLLSRDGARVIDFGIAHTADASALTMTGQQVGTPAYMSPEQAGGRAVGTESDVFSLASVLAFTATGEAPFGSGSTGDVLHRVIHSAPSGPVLGRIAAGDPALADLVGHCLAKNPADRPIPPRIVEVSQANRPAPAWPEPVMLVSQERASWHGRTAVESPIDQPTVLRRPAPKRPTAPETPKRRRRAVILATAACTVLIGAVVAFVTLGLGGLSFTAQSGLSTPLDASPSASPSPPPHDPKHTRSPSPHPTPSHASTAPPGPGENGTEPALAPQPPRTSTATATSTVTVKPPAPEQTAPWKSCHYYSGTALTQYGDQGDRVRQVQCILDRRGYNIGSAGVDGYFGADTRAAVKRFQSPHHLEVDGQVGTQTWAKLRG
jgi:serine/threonine protein kinase